MKKLKKDKETLTTEIFGIIREKDELTKNIKDHNSNVMEIKKRNFMKIEEYKDTLNMLNKGAFNTTKQSNESESDYLQRLKDLAEVETPEEELQTAILKINKQFLKNMHELIKDEDIIGQVANTIDPFGKVDNKYKLLKMWSSVKTKFLNSYGADNKRISANDILTFFRVFLTVGKTGLPMVVENELINTKEIKKPANGGKLDNLTFSHNPQENYFLITNNDGEDKHLFLKPVIVTKRSGHNDTYALLYSFKGEKDSFKQFFDGYKSGIPYDRTLPFSVSGSSNSKLKSSNEILNNTGITKAQIQKIFKQSSAEINPNPICKVLIDEYNITPLQANEAKPEEYTLTIHGSKVGTMYGYGIQGENLPKIVPFGDLYLYLHKLYYENTLSVRNKNMKVIAGFRTMKISEPFMKLLLNMMKGLNPTHSDLDSLKTGERQVYDRLINLAHLNKNVVHQKDNTVKELKKRLKLLEAEIEIGNNSPLIKKEIYGILHSLREFKVITQSQIDKYLKNIS